MLLSNSIRVLLRSRSRLKPSFLQAAHTIKFSTQPENNNVEVPSILEERPLDRLLENNRSWRKSMLKKDPSYFKNMAEGQQPEYLIIGCSDSRLGAEKIMGLDMGEVFVHRNIANVFIPTDMNLLSVLFYATTVLKVKDIIILGHYGCGGVLAASQDGDLGYFEHWLRNIRNVQDRYKDELDAISDSDDRHRRLVELNVQEQCFSLYANNLVRSENAKNNRPRVHGMVYDIGEGLLKNLDIDFQSEANQYRDTLTAADYEKCVPLNINHVIGKKVAGSEIDRLVTIESGGGKRSFCTLKCSGNTTVRHLKLAVRSVSGIPVERQILYYNNIILCEDDASLYDIGTEHIYPVTLKESFVPDLFRRP